MSVGEEVAGGDAADGLMDVHGRDLSGSSAIKVQPLLLCLAACTHSQQLYIHL